MHLVDRGGLDVLDRPGLDDREQALGVTAGAGADRDAAGGRRGRDQPRSGRSATATPPPPPPRRCRRRRPRPRPRRRGPWPPGCARAGGRGSCDAASRRRCALGGRRGVGRRRGLGAAALGLALAAAALARASSARLRRCSGISVMGSLAPGHHSGPEMPPSLRTRQKWMAMKMTMTNGSISTCSTYHRSSVSVPISAPPSSTKRTWSPNTGV